MILMINYICMRQYNPEVQSSSSSGRAAEISTGGFHMVLKRMKAIAASATLFAALSMAVDTLGNCLYVANGNFVESYSIDQTSGALTWLETTDNGSHIWDMTVVSLP